MCNEDVDLELDYGSLYKYQRTERDYIQKNATELFNTIDITKNVILT